LADCAAYDRQDRFKISIRSFFMLNRIIDVLPPVYNAEGEQLSPRDPNRKHIRIHPHKRLQARIDRVVLQAHAACRRLRTAGEVGALRHPLRWMKPSDTVVDEILCIGTLRRGIVSEVLSNDLRDATVAGKSHTWNRA
jgi:hypothetical protein